MLDPEGGKTGHAGHATGRAVRVVEVPDVIDVDPGIEACNTSWRGISPAAMSSDCGVSQLEAPLVGTPYSFAERGDTRQLRKVPASMSVTWSGLIKPAPENLVPPHRVCSHGV